MSALTKEMLLGRLLYCQDRSKFCRAGGIHGEHFNYGLPCVGGVITFEDGSETISASCIFCGSTSNG